MRPETQRFIGEGQGTGSPGLSKVGQHQVEHLLDWTADLIGQVFARPLVSTASQSLARPLLHKGLDLADQIGPNVGSACLGKRGEVHEERNSMIDAARCIALIMKTGYVSFDGLGQPARTDAILALGPEIVLLNHGASFLAWADQCDFMRPHLSLHPQRPPTKLKKPKDRTLR